VKWVRDPSGRLPERPHYDPAELDRECESLVNTFLRRRHGHVSLPLSTDDLAVLVEEHVADLDLYADLAADGPGVEGVTEFAAKGKPRVRIAAALSDSPARAYRLRTTLAHELGHVRFHAFLWSGASFGARAGAGVRCLRDSIARPRQSDWLEWQAGYACGAILMPSAALDAVVRAALDGRPTPLFFRSEHARRLARQIARAFDVSAQAATVRLTQTGCLTRDVPTAIRNRFLIPAR
jgi:hypothetical protein